MNRGRISAAGAVLSMFLLVIATHPVWVLTLIACGFAYGWEFGKRYIPKDGAEV